MIDNDTFEAQFAAAWRAEMGGARLDIDAKALAHAVALQYPRRRLRLPRLVSPQTLVWLALPALLAALTLAVAAVGMRPSPVPPTQLGLLAFQRGSHTYLADEDSGRIFMVDGPAGGLDLGAWSPDGKWLSLGAEGKVYLLDAETLDLQAAPIPARVPVFSSPTPPPPGPTASPNSEPPEPPGAVHCCLGAGWLPIGESLLIGQTTGGVRQTVAVDLDDGTTTDLRTDDLCHVAVSPDARFVAAVDVHEVIETGRFEGKIVIVDLATGSRFPVADFGGLGCGYWWGFDVPGWSPDSERIAIVTTGGIRVIRRDGSDPVDVVALDFPRGNDVEHRTDMRPVWSPNGEWIAFSSPDGLEVVRPDGTDRHLVVSGRALLGSFAWTQDSTHLEYGVAISENRPEDYVLSSVDVNTGLVRTIDLAQPYVYAFARQPVTAETPQTMLP